VTTFELAAPDPVDYLGRVASTDLGQAYKQQMLDLLGLRLGHTVLDVGCGPGTDLATLAAATGADGRVIGVDRDPVMVTRATERAVELPTVAVGLADAHHLPIASATADRARTDRVLQHVLDPRRALVELRRTLRPGGRLVMGEPGWRHTPGSTSHRSCR